MTNDDRPLEPTPLPAPVTGVARAGQGTGTALDDTEVYDVADFTAASAAAEAAVLAPEPANLAPEPAPAEPLVEAAAVAPVPRSAPRPASRRTSTDWRPRVGAPVAGLVGFAIAAGLAILIGASLGGMNVPGGAANDNPTPGATSTSAPAATEVPDAEGGNGKGGKGCKGNGNGNGNCDND